MLKIACIPAYNVEKMIGEVIKKCLEYVDKVIVCDDGSDDNTADASKKSGATVLRQRKNRGKGAALQLLFEHAKKLDADIMVTIDGDGQFLPEEIPKLMVPILEMKSDIVIGYRFENESEMPYYRKIGNKMLDRFSSLAAELPFRDTQSGFRSYSKKAIQAIKFTAEGFGADSEILVDASRKGLRISEQKISVIYNTGGKTSSKNPVTHAADVLYTVVEIISIRQPLRYLGIPGLILTIIGIAYSITVITIFNDTRYFSVPSTLVSLGSLVMGILLLLMSAVLFSISRALKKQI